MTPDAKHALQTVATNIRIGALTAVYSARSGHPGGSLSIAEILAYLYFKEMNVDPKRPDDPMRDRLVLSKGHTCPALYAALAERGYFDRELLSSFRHVGSILQGHPDMKHIPGVDMSSGSLGQGVSAACGIALAAKLDGAPYRVYAIMGDGEQEEGQVWEAAMFAAHHKLDNLCVFVDYNGLQIDGDITEVLNPTPLDEKYRAFGFDVFVIDGHSFDEIEAALAAAKQSDKPCAIIAKCIKGRGVSFMENRYEWHGNAPNEEQYKQAIAELSATL